MIEIAIALVLASGFLHAVWNLYTKKSMNKNVFLWCCQMVSVLIFLPWALLDLFSLSIPPVGFFLLPLSVLLHGAYVLLLAAAYTIGDMSQVYPIMRGTSPILVPLLAVAFLQQSLPILGWVGVAFIVIGIVSMSGLRFKGTSTESSSKAIRLAFAVGVCIASYIVVDARTLQYVSPVVLNEASNLGNALALSWAAYKSGAIHAEWSLNWKTILLGGLIAPGGYLLFLYALSLAPVAQLAPMREIGTVFGTLFGIFLLRERQGTRRIASSLLITMGVIMLGMNGH